MWLLCLYLLGIDLSEIVSIVLFLLGLSASLYYSIIMLYIGKGQEFKCGLGMYQSY